ncbi:MAG: hypothetical protein ACKOEC_14550 [Acidimicrobiia bacterium]
MPAITIVVIVVIVIVLLAALILLALVTPVLSVPALPGASRTLDVAKFSGLFDNASAFLFMSNSSEGTTFQNASLREP